MVNKTLTVISAKKGVLPVRVVPLNNNLPQKFERWFEEDEGTGCLVNYKGRPIASLKTAWRTAKKKAKITRPMRMYAIRHMSISDMISGGADLRSVADSVGHASPDMTLKVYAHSPTRQKRSAVDKLE